MNRKAKNIIFWTVIGILAFLFVVTLVFGCIRTIAGPGTAVYNGASKIITAIGFNKSDFFTYSPYVCIASGVLCSFMFYKKYNTRIN